MSANFIVIVGGAPASGKTTIAEKLSEDFSLPLIRKDAIKELLFDELGWSDREWSRKLGKSTYGLMYQQTEAELEAGRSIILESDFKAEFDNKKFQDLQKRFGVKSFQIFCAAPAEVLLKRFRSRVESGERHPGHTDQDNYGIFEPKYLAETFLPLDLEGELIKIDSSELFESYYPEISTKFTRFKTGLV